jgi:hypothetical protein
MPWGLVDGRGIAMVDAIVVLEVEANGSAIVDLHGHGFCVDLLDGPKGTVLHAKAAFVLQEHDAVPAGEVALAALECEPHVIPQIVRRLHLLPRGLVQRAYFVVGVGKDDPAALRRCLLVTVPVVDQIAPRLLAG